MTASLAGAVAVACAGPPRSNPASAPPPPTPFNYVAVGDSYAAAPGVPDEAPPAGCRKSTNGYPAILARRLAATSFANVTCSGAKTENITGSPQRTLEGPVEPQIDAVDPTTDLITITIGANDVELQADAEGCEVTSPHPVPCSNEFEIGNVDRISQAITAELPAWGALIDRLRDTAPHARIVIVGYGTFVRPGGCFPEQPVLPRDADYLQSKLNELDDAQQQLAATKAIDYFDTRQLSRGHDICAAPADRYIEGFKTTGSTVRLHPNAFGEAAVGNALAGFLGKPGARLN